MTLPEALDSEGFRFCSGVPCSALGEPGPCFVLAANEGDAVAMAAGARLGGVRAAAMMQNSGLGNAVNPLTSLVQAYRIPLLLLVTLRGDPQGPPDEPQHELMGRITAPLLELMGIPWSFLDEPASSLGRAVASLEEGSSHALVIRPGTLGRGEPGHRPAWGPTRAPATLAPAEPRATREEMVAAARSALGPRDALLAATGYTAREVLRQGDADGHFYMVGSMGCLAALALGLALARPDRRFVALDGDGAVLMRMGTLATLGRLAPPNLVHVVLDNGLHESTGGQETGSAGLDLGAVAAACGHPRVERCNTPDDLARFLRQEGGGVAHVPILPGAGRLPRPEESLPHLARRFAEFLA